MIKVVFFHRKRRAGNFSIENLFKQIRTELPPDVSWDVKELSYFSNGFFKRFYICLEALFNQGTINHITGDVHFIAAFLRRRRTILTVHDLGFLNRSNDLIRKVLKWFWLTMPVNKSAIITTVSEASKFEILRHSKIDPSRIKVIYNPISPLFTPLSKKFNKENPVILQIGTKYNKNIIRLAEALRGISCHLEIVGSLDPLTKEMLNRTRISYHSSVNLSDDEIVQRYYAADIISFVSLFEGFGLPIVEGNAVGRAVITSNVSAMPEIAGNAAHLVDPLDISSIRSGILKIIHDDKYREQLIANGFENRNRFNAKHIAMQYVELYKSLIG